MTYDEKLDKLISRLLEERQMTRKGHSTQVSFSHGSITDSEYDKYYETFRNKLAGIKAREAMLQEADDNYYITAQYLVELANKAYDLFKSSEVEERRQLIKLTLSNLKLEGKNVRYDLLKPFDTIAKYADRQSWLPR